MVNWKKLFEEDSTEELETKSSKEESKVSSRRKSLFEEENVADLYDEEDDYYAALEAELGNKDDIELDLEEVEQGNNKKKSKFSFFKNSKKFEEDELEDYDEEDDYYSALEEEVNSSEKDKKKSSSFSFFKKSKDKEEDLYEEYEELDEEFEEFDDEFESETEKQQEKKSAFSFANLKEKFARNKKEDVEEIEDIEDIENIEDIEEIEYTEDFQEREVEPAKSKRSFFSFASLKEMFATKSKTKEDEEDLDEEFLEEKDNSEDKDVYFESFDLDDDVEDEFVELEKEEVEPKKSKFSFFNKGSKEREERAKDFFEEEEFDEEEEYGKAREGGIFSKLAFLFQTKDKDVKSQVQEEYEEYEEYEDDEAEDYKTYLEKQKAQRYEEKFDEEYEEDFEDDFEDDLEYKENKKSSRNEFLSSVKDKFDKFTSSGLKEDEDLDEYDYDEELEYSKDKEKPSFFGKFMNKINKTKEETLEEEDVDFEIEYQDESISDKLENIEEKEISEDEEENISIQETLKSLGINAENIRSVDVFEDRGAREERRAHPTLASVKVRRILQEKEIDAISYDLSLADSKDKFVSRLNTSNKEKLAEDLSEGFHHSKNEEEIAKLNEDFNKVNRKQNRISTSENFLRDSNSDKIDVLMNNIKSTQEEISRDTRDYSIEIEESEGAASRRAKMRYTSLDDILEGNEEFLETDIDRSKYDEYQDADSHPEEIQNLRKDLFKEKTSLDLVSKERRSNLDELILDTNLVENSKDKESEEILKLEENLELIRDDKKALLTQDEDIEEEISIEKVARDSEYNFEDYEELKSWDTPKSRDSYSNYRLEEDEIESLKTQSTIDYKSDQTDIESLNREIKQRKVDEYRAQYWGNKSQDDGVVLSSTRTKAAEDNAYQDALSKKFQAEKSVGIEYQEKLYTNDVGEYFVEENAPLTFGEYKTQDRGYRPVSREQMVEKQRRLEEIFDKYSNVRIPRRNTTEYVESKISSPKRVDKYKPTQVISPVHGTNISSNLTKKETTKKDPKKNYFKEIASEEEFAWDLDLSPRVSKKKKAKK